MDQNRKPILCIDFDGVIHSYTSPWVAADVIPDPPVPGALAWLVEATRYFDICIYSSRSKSLDGVEAMKRWLTNHAGTSFLAENLTFSREKPPAFLTIDDRAVCFDGDWSDLDPKKLLGFKPWNKR